jgi:hypothetical protein
VDVIGVLDRVEPWAVITRKDGTDTRKRSATIRDDSGRSVEVCGQLKAVCVGFGVTSVRSRACGCLMPPNTSSKEARWRKQPPRAGPLALPPPQ